MSDVDLLFNQHMIQDYLECRRRFQLRYLQHLAWPAEQTSDQIAFEQHIRQGEDFHRLIQQSILGIPEEVLLANTTNPELGEWWQSFKAAFPALASKPDKNGTCLYLAEHTLRGLIGSENVLAKYDLVVIEPGKRIQIYDWKTTHSPISPQTYRQKAQTRIYLWLLVSAGALWNSGRQFLPENIEMTYWSPVHPDDPVAFSYDSAKFQADTIWLDTIIKEIRSLGEDEFDKTEDETRCKFCNYRSLCNRGNKPGNSEELQEQSDLNDLDLSSIQAIEY